MIRRPAAQSVETSTSGIEENTTEAKKPKKPENRAKRSSQKVKANNVQPVDPAVWRVDGRPTLTEAAAASTMQAPGDRGSTEATTQVLRERLRELQVRLLAEQSQSLLIVLQAMDAGGKDGTVKSLYLGMNPTGAAIHSFSVPTEEERAHDFLWRIHARTPGKGTVTIFNRSHYEDVLAVRVRKISPPAVWQPRFDIINEFEAGLTSARTRVVKIMLHISKDEQQLRLQSRIDDPSKRWKFRMGDLEDRALWPEYKRAYQDMIAKTSTKDAPWYVVPADKKWYRDFAVMNIVVGTLESMKPDFPPLKEFDGLVIP